MIKLDPTTVDFPINITTTSGSQFNDETIRCISSQCSNCNFNSIVSHTLDTKNGRMCIWWRV